MNIRFWGTRGSIPAPGPENARYGGNTTCVEIRGSDGTIFVIDAGTGIRKLGISLLKEQQSKEINMFFTHSHWDHIQGFPFFVPAFSPKYRVKIIGCNTSYNKVKSILANQMEWAYFPVSFDSLKADISYEAVDKHGVKIGSLKIEFIEANHPGGCHGIKCRENGKTFVFLTDNELRSEEYISPFESFVSACKGVDLLVHDAMFTAKEMPQHRGWGHSSIEETMELAGKAEVIKLGFFHHDPERTDEQMDLIVEESNKTIKSSGHQFTCFGVKEGDTFNL